VATELHIQIDTVEPSMLRASSQPASKRVTWAGIQSRLQPYAVGRLLLDGMRWSVVAALVLSGYFAAAGINSGVVALRDGVGAANAQQILAASAAHK
jgi:hypothetical protein